MQDTHHTYESLHQEHHAWRRYLIGQKQELQELSQNIARHLEFCEHEEDKIICNELDARRNLLITEIDNKLRSLTATDALMSRTGDTHHVVSQQLFLINSRMRAGLLEFDQGCSRLKRDVSTLD